LDPAIVRCYQILGLEAGASLDAIKKAYRDLIQVWHPDRFEYNPQLKKKAEDTLKDINWAYEALARYVAAARNGSNRKSHSGREGFREAYQDFANSENKYDGSRQQHSRESDFERQDFDRWKAEKEKKAASLNDSKAGQSPKQKCYSVIVTAGLLVLVLSVLGLGKSCDRESSRLVHSDRGTGIASSWEEKARSLQSQQDFQSLVEHCRKWVASKPRDAGAWNFLGMAYDSRRQYAEAIDAFDKAIRLKPDDAEAWYNLGVAYGSTRSYDKEISAYLEAIRLNPHFVNAWNNLGVAYMKLKQDTKAIDALRRATRLKPDYAQAWKNLGLEYYMVDDLNSAKKVYQILRRLDPAMAEDYLRVIMS